MEKQISKLAVTSLMAAAALLTGCSSAEDAVNPTTPETTKTMQITLRVDNTQTRIASHDGIDANPQTFNYEWQVGDTLRYWDQSTKKKGYMLAQANGNPIVFTGTVTSGDILNGDKLSLISGNCAIDANKGTATADITGQVGTLDALANSALFYGTTTATISGNAVTLADTRLDQKMAILRMNCIFSKADYDAGNANLAAFSLASETSKIQKQVSCSLSDGTITPTGESQSYLRITFNKIQTATAIEGHAGYYSTKVYIAITPNTLPADATLNAFSAKAITYNEQMDLSGITLASNDVKPININYCKTETKHEPAISCPGFKFSLSPGEVIAYRSTTADGWNYKFADNQGDIYGKDKTQSDTYGIYFTWGSVKPMDVHHKVVSTNKLIDAIGYSPSTFTDVASKCGDTKWRMPTKAEAQVILNAINSGTNHEGTYQTKDKDGNTVTVSGVYIGTSEQPTVADQDNYFFLPYSGDLHYKGTKNDVTMDDGKNILYFATPPLYRKTQIETSDNRNISIWCSGSEEKPHDGYSMAYRLQYNFSESHKTDNSVATREAGYGRIIRAVRY